MASDEVGFKHVGLSSDRAVIFCEMNNGKIYAMPVAALDRAENWNPKAKPQAVEITHDGYAAVVEFDRGSKIDFPSDFVLHVCEPAYSYSKGNRRAMSGVGKRIREIREARGLTLDALAAKSRIAKPNLSRLENDRVTPTFGTLKIIAAALDTHPALMISAKKPDHAWTWTLHEFTEWKERLVARPTNSVQPPVVNSREADLVNVFLATRPEHRYALKKLKAQCAPDRAYFFLDAAKWQHEIAAAEAAMKRAKGRRPKARKKELARH